MGSTLALLLLLLLLLLVLVLVLVLPASLLPTPGRAPGWVDMVACVLLMEKLTPLCCRCCC